MEPVLSVEEMKEIELLTSKELKITEIDLMKEAGILLAQDFLERAKPDIDDLVTVVSSVGNNGGDGLVMFLELLKRGYNSKLIIIGDLEKATTGFKYYFNLASNEAKIIFMTNDNALDIKKAMFSSQFVIDAIIGIGLSRPIADQYLEMIDYINSLNSIVYSIDLPSGINPNNGRVYHKAIKAEYTGIIGFYKYGNVLNDALDYHGHIKVLDIGLVKKHEVNVKIIFEDDYLIAPKKRNHNSYKYHYGLGYFIGGSKTMPGAINLSVLAALRSGQGIAHVIQEKPVAWHLEVIYEDIFDDIDFSNVDSIVFGPGLNPNHDKYQEIYNLINQSDIKSVIDAGGLKYVDLENINNPNLIFTPHEKELSDLCSASVNDIEEEPFKYIHEVVEKGVTLVLKGQTTVIANRKHIYLYQAKNPGLATAGSGDVLTGLISSYLNDNLPLSACIKAVILHSRAAAKARETYGQVSMIASDIIDNIHHVLKEVENEI